MSEFEAWEKLILLSGVLFLFVVYGWMIGLAFGRVVGQWILLQGVKHQPPHIYNPYKRYLKNLPRG